MARDSPDRFQKLNERPDRKVEALLLWLLEETPGSARKLIPWALRDWARHGVNKASNHRGEEADTAESACDQAKVKILRALSESADQASRAWSLMSACAVESPWATIAHLVTLSLDSGLSPAGSSDLVVKMVQTLPCLSVGAATCSQLQFLSQEAAAAASMVHQPGPSRSAASKHLKCVEPCNAAGASFDDISAAAESIERMLQGNLTYLDAQLRREAASAIRRAVGCWQGGLCEWMSVCLSSSQGLLKSRRVQDRLVAVFILDILLQQSLCQEGCALLTETMLDVDPEVCGMACESLVCLASEGAENARCVLQAVEPLAKSGAVEVRKSVMEVVNAALRQDDLCQAERAMVGKLATEALRGCHQELLMPALSILSRVGEFPAAVAAVLELTDAPDEDIRNCALDALATVAAPGDETVVGVFLALADAATRPTAKVRALEALTILAQCGHAGALHLALGSLGSTNAATSRASLRLLNRVCPLDSDAIIVSMSKDVACLARMLSPDDLGAVLYPLEDQTGLYAALAACLRCGAVCSDSHWTVRRAVLLGLAKCSGHSCQAALKLVELSFDDDNDDVCETAVETFLSLSAAGDANVVEKLRGIRASKAMQVQEAIDIGLEKLQERIHQRCTSSDIEDLETEAEAAWPSSAVQLVPPDECRSEKDVHPLAHSETSSSTFISSDCEDEEADDTEVVACMEAVITEDVPTMLIEELFEYYDRLVIKESTLQRTPELSTHDASDATSSNSEFELVLDDMAQGEQAIDCEAGKDDMQPSGSESWTFVSNEGSE